jgi:hypothetical protein
MKDPSKKKKKKSGNVQYQNENDPEDYNSVINTSVTVCRQAPTTRTWCTKVL